MKTHPLRAAARSKVEAVPLGTNSTVQVTAVRFVVTARCQNGFHRAANGLKNGYQNKASSGISAKFPIMLVYRTSHGRCYRLPKPSQIALQQFRTSELRHEVRYRNSTKLGVHQGSELASAINAPDSRNSYPWEQSVEEKRCTHWFGKGDNYHRYVVGCRERSGGVPL